MVTCSNINKKKNGERRSEFYLPVETTGIITNEINSKLGTEFTEPARMFVEPR